MVDISQVFSGDTLKAADLQGHEPTVVIESVEVKDFENGKKLVIRFVGKKKALVANKTNSGRIAFGFGTNTDNWVGKKIQLFTDLVDFQGKPVEAIRVRPVKESPTAPTLQQPRPSAPFNDSVSDIGETF